MSVIWKKTIPSYVYIEGYEFFVTYEGQMSTCRYCGQRSHKQLDCPQRKEDYPQPPIINVNRQKGKHADPPAEKNNAIDFGSANSEPCTTATTEKCKHNEATEKSEVTKKKREREASSPDLPKDKIMNCSEDKINCSCSKCNNMVCFSERSANNYVNKTVCKHARLFLSQYDSYVQAHHVYLKFVVKYYCTLKSPPNYKLS